MNDGATLPPGRGTAEGKPQAHRLLERMFTEGHPLFYFSLANPPETLSETGIRNPGRSERILDQLLHRYEASRRACVEIGYQRGA